jgi:hypothetical protein
MSSDNKVTAYTIRLQEHDAERLAERAKRAKKSPAQWMRDRVIAALDGNDPAEYREMIEELARLEAAVSELSRAELLHAQAVKKYTRRADYLLSQSRSCGSGCANRKSRR